MRTATIALAATSLALTACSDPTKPSTPATHAQTYVLDHAATRLDGSREDLSTYEGRVILITNTASECGFTPQYETLEKLYRQKQEEGLVVLGFPSNDFMGQEPLSNDQIAEFCSSNYAVTFPMYQKTSVTGDDAHPLFAEMNEAVGAPSWNFNKYLIDRDGHVVARYGSRIAPDDPALVGHIDRLLARTANAQHAP